MNLTIRDIERIWVNVPYRPIPARNMIRELPHWTIFELCRVKLANGVEGVGETMCFYTWGTVTDETVERVRGRTATDVMWDDTIGAGLQIQAGEDLERAHEVLGLGGRHVPASNQVGHSELFSIACDALGDFGWSADDRPVRNIGEVLRASQRACPGPGHLRRLLLERSPGSSEHVSSLAYKDRTHERYGSSLAMLKLGERLAMQSVVRLQPGERLDGRSEVGKA